MSIEYEHMPGMNGGQFPRIEKRSFLTDVVIKYKLAKDYSSAQRVLLICSIIFFALSLYFFLG